MKIAWALAVAIAVCVFYIVLTSQQTAAPVMHMIANPNCFPAGTEGVDGFSLCTGDVYRAVTFENT